MNNSALVSIEWLQQNLLARNLSILDATFFLPRQQRNALKEYQKHIQGAQFFDIDRIANQESPLPHSLPTAKQFSNAVGRMGIDHYSQVIIYDNNHFFAAARAWWMFRVFGHKPVRILDGGLKRWTQLDLPVDSVQFSPARKIYRATYRPELIYDLRQMRHIQQTGSHQILDARSADSFQGQRPMTDPGLQPGHIPNSINIPYVSLTDSEQHTLLPNQPLQLLFEDAGVNLSQPCVTTCGSGVSAAVLLLALYQIGLTDIPMYDGSWAEWGRQADTPKQTVK